ncbi:hypothetical protein [Streptomyces sp. NPDC059092]|uniref:hypothetical protein n=1 Tax=Streptomyces sp. NPDC059092 TaxID=3346725 RepID=UPI0036A0BB78
MPDVPVPPVPKAVPAAHPASAAPVPPVVIAVVPAEAVPAGSTVVLTLSADSLPDGATPALPPLPPYPPSVPEQRLTRRLREWNLAWWFAVAAATLEVPVSHELAYYLHQHGLISPLEYWFPLG